MNNKPTSSYHILRVGMGITFVWIGALILRDPFTWAAFIDPWIRELLPIDPVQTMYGIAVFDIIIGFLLLVNVIPWLVALLASIHLLSVLIVAGIDEITVRDIGLLTGTIAIFWTALPDKYKERLKKQARTSEGNS